MQPKLKLVVNNKDMSVEEYDRKVQTVWAFALGVMAGLLMAAWMAVGR